MGTIDYYNKNAKYYCDKTINANMVKQYEMFLKYIKESGKILDYGCGSGRDSLYFKNLGYEVFPIDGSEEICKIAREYTGLDVKCMDFFDLNDKEFYDGIWACSSILHVQRSRFIEVLKKMRDAIKKDGYMYVSFADGFNQEEYKEDGRYFNDLSKESFTEYSTSSGLEVVEFSTNSSNVQAHNNVYWNSFILKRR